MTVLTWRDVAAPDFRGVQDGIQNFSNLLNSGLGAARAGLEKFDQSKTDEVNNAVLTQLAGAQDESAAKALLASLSSNPNASRLTTATLNAAMARPGDLLKQASDESDLNFTNYNREKIKASDTALKEANPILHQAGLLAASGKMDAAYKLIADNPQATGNLTADQFFSSIKDLQGTEQGDTSTRSGRFEYGRTIQDYQDNQNAIQLINSYRHRGLSQEDFASTFEADRQSLIKQGYSPAAIEKARAALMGESPTDASFGGTDPSGGASAGGGSSGAGDPVRSMNYVARGKGIPAIPDNIQTLGQWSDWATGLNNRGIKETAGGVYQIVGRTLRAYAPRALGADWQSKPLTAANQDAVAKEIWQDNRGSVASLRKQWPSLSDAEAAQVARLPWEQARNIIAKGESGVSDVSTLLAQATQNFQAGAGPQYNRANDPQQVFAQKAFPLLNDSSSPRQIASKLVAEGGDLAGENLGNVAEKLDSIAQKYGISPALAGLVLTESLGGNQGTLGRVADFFHLGDGLGADVKGDAIDKFAKLAKDRNAIIRKGSEALANDASSQLVASTAAAQSAAQAALAAKARRARALGRGFNPSQAIADAAVATDLHGQAMTNSAAVTQAGGNQPPPPPRTNQRNIPKPAPKVVTGTFRPRNAQEALLFESLKHRGK